MNISKEFIKLFNEKYNNVLFCSTSKDYTFIFYIIGIEKVIEFNFYNGWCNVVFGKSHIIEKVDINEDPQKIANKMLNLLEILRDFNLYLCNEYQKRITTNHLDIINNKLDKLIEMIEYHPDNTQTMEKLKKEFDDLKKQI